MASFRKAFHVVIPVTQAPTKTKWPDVGDTLYLQRSAKAYVDGLPVGSISDHANGSFVGVVSSAQTPGIPEYQTMGVTVRSIVVALCGTYEPIQGPPCIILPGKGVVRLFTDISV